MGTNWSREFMESESQDYQFPFYAQMDTVWDGGCELAGEVGNWSKVKYVGTFLKQRLGKQNLNRIIMHAKVEVKVGGERLRSGEVKILMKQVPNLKTGQLKEGQRARGTQRHTWVLSKPVWAVRFLLCCGLGHSTPYKALAVILQNLGSLSRICLLFGISQELAQSGTSRFHPIDAGALWVLCLPLPMLSRWMPYPWIWYFGFLWLYTPQATGKATSAPSIGSRILV